jgi:L-rhamnose isomerase
MELENAGDLAAKLALLEELKTMPLGAVWDMYCAQQNAPAGTAWINDMLQYDRNVIRKR